MIVIRAFLHPYGEANEEEMLAEAHVWNDRSGTREVGNYGVKAWTLPPSADSRRRLVEPSMTYFRGKVSDFPRNDKNVLFLAAQALTAAMADEEPRRW